MRTTQQFSITLPHQMADMVRNKVAKGEYASESEVIRAGMRALMTWDQALEDWLRQVAIPSYEALKANPEQAITLDQMRAEIAAQHKKATSKS